MGQAPVDKAYSAEDYEARAEKWARLASLTHDQRVRSEILEVRRTYIELAARLRRQEWLGNLSILESPEQSKPEQSKAP
jgi:hypothetical protein